LIFHLICILENGAYEVDFRNDARGYPLYVLDRIKKEKEVQQQLF